MANPVMISKVKRIRLSSLLVLLYVLLSSEKLLAEPMVLRVGVYENPPKLGLGENDQVSGILGDILQGMAAEENWQLVAVPCFWNDCLEQLATGEIDILPDVAASTERSELYDFHTTAALLSWSQIYVKRGHTLSSLLELDGKRLALLKGSIQYDYLRQLAENFNIDVTFVLVDTQQAAFAALESNVADAVTANNFISELKAAELNLKSTPVVFQPSRLFFAVPKNKHAEVLQAIDSYLQQWQADADSPYFTILKKWNSTPAKVVIPDEIWWLLIALLVGFLSALLFSLLMRRRVKEKNSSLRQTQQNLNMILDSVDAHVYIKDLQLRYQYVNKNVCKLINLEEKQIIGQTDELFFDAETCKRLRKNDLLVLEKGQRVVEEEINRVHGIDNPQTFLSVKLPLRREDGTIYALCGISTDITDYLLIQKQLRKLALYDSLTGLANRRQLMEFLEESLAHGRQTETEGALLIVDLDAFKTLNDTLGHHAGDLLLQEVSKRLQSRLLPHELAARLGSDEFVIVKPNMGENRHEVEVIAQRCAEEILQDFVLPYVLDQTQYIASASVGIALFSDADGDVERLLQDADMALYRAKSSGRNSLRFFDPTMQLEVNRRSQLERKLREAISQHQLELYVQPQISSDQQYVGMEALLRWHDPVEGFISPADFIPIAESSGLIIPLGAWVLREACHILAEWAKVPEMENLTLAVNISPRQFRHLQFIDYIDSCLDELGVNPNHLELEVTESLLIEDIDQTIERMNELRQRGLRFALDDFGTGYASLSYLKLLPLNKLKIDQSFVRDVLTDINDEAIVSTIIALGQSLDLAVIAEGVETVEQAVLLEKFGCHVYQGYYFGKPAPVAEWQQIITAKRSAHKTEPKNPSQIHS
ncbi:EAL domain-containing protein [Methylophaga pinxianii]|uniref:EAL domain-containing protein n=1 Tax=Methylophaga pinxianii TaxID=2881052 RepID=UPI001CF2145B|nr:EAL domain-containing protein [Methylophaga pinxianii]MCB2425967.1 EAL domain-containing protein [Methylophaga pinxianii]UPH46810.1 EAL domain-containing protein [Methylophaga pinxianii]